MKDRDNICLDVHDGINVYDSVSPAIVQTSSFMFKDYQHYLDVNEKKEIAYTYTRDGNPTIELLEKKLAALEHAQYACAFASGMGAISGTLLSLLRQGDHVIIVNTVYGSSVKLIAQLEKYGVKSTKIDVKKTEEIFNYVCDQTKVIYFESPSSQKFELLDLKQISDYCHQKNIMTIIDNTWATPLLQNPLDHGIDFVIHSCSKYIGGHSDLVGGITLSNHDKMKDVESFARVLLGATMSPMNAWLALRGLRTLPVRIKQHHETVIAFIEELQNDPRIEKIYHPYVQQKELSQKYLNGYGSLLGIVLKDASPERLKDFVDHLKMFTLAYSWGGFESLVMSAYKGNNEEELKQRGLSLGHLRIYLGLEEKELLIKDFKEALEYAYRD